MTRQLGAALKAYGFPAGVLVALWVLFELTTERFGGTGTVYAVLSNFAVLGLVAAGLALTFIAGEMDLSVGSVAVLAAVIAVKISTIGLIPSVMLAAIGGLALGAAQGRLVMALGVNSLVFTIGSQIAMRGAAFMISGDRPAQMSDLTVADPLLERWGIVAPDIIVALVVIAALGVFCAFLRPGRRLYAIGGGRAEARAAGVPITASVVVAFALCGGCAALAGALSGLKGGGVSPEAHVNLILLAPAATLIGGFSLHGGRGTIGNVVLGVGVLSVLTVGLGARGAPAHVTELYVGVLLAVVVGGTFMVDRVSARRRLAIVGSPN